MLAAGNCGSRAVAAQLGTQLLQDSTLSQLTKELGLHAVSCGALATLPNTPVAQQLNPIVGCDCRSTPHPTNRFEVLLWQT